MNVPDVTGGAFALSGIVLRSGEHTERRELLDSDGFSLRPADALRAFAPGSQLSFMFEVYNAGTAVQTVTSLWRDTVRLAVLRADTLALPPRGGPLAVAGGLKLPGGLAAGTYVLQLAATSPGHPPIRNSLRRRARRAADLVRCEIGILRVRSEGLVPA